MAHTKGDSRPGSQHTQEEHHKRGVFSKVKDKLDFTKHLGFQSGPDTLANRQALANAIEREAREADEKDNSEPAPGFDPSDDSVADGGQKKRSEKGYSEPIQFDQSPQHSTNGIEDKTSSDEQPKEKPESHTGWSRWMAHKVHQVSRAAASKDLSDELLKKEPKDTKKK